MNSTEQLDVFARPLYSRWLRIFLLAIYLVLVGLVPQFGQSVAALESDTPKITGILLDSSWIYLVFGLVAVATLSSAASKPANKFWRAFWLNLIAAIVVIVATFVILYLPALTSRSVV